MTSHFAQRLSVILVTMMFALPSAHAETNATDLNAQGYRHYKAGRYAEAIDLFNQAIQKDPKLALPHYNLAATLALVRGKGKTCEFEAYGSTIVDHLRDAVALDPSRRERMKKDSDFDSIRTTVGYWIVSGLSPEKEDDARAILTSTHWHGDGRFIDPRPLEDLRFLKGGKAELRSRGAADEGRGPVFGAWKSIRGTYTTKDGVLTLRLEKPFSHPFTATSLQTFRVEKEWGTVEAPSATASIRLIPEDQAEEKPLVFYDHPSECEAF